MLEVGGNHEIMGQSFFGTKVIERSDPLVNICTSQLVHQAIVQAGHISGVIYSEQVKLPHSKNKLYMAPNHTWNSKDMYMFGVFTV